MSSVRMCDKCKTVFSENDEGWQTFTANTIKYDDEDRQISVQIRQDLCAECAIPTRPRKLSKEEQRLAELQATNAKLDELTAKINALPAA